MLVQLAIRNIVLIDRLDLAFGRGLTVLTGETGAGKSILLDAFALALGSRGDGSLVRAGEAQTAAAVLGHNYPDSQWYKDAFARLQTGGLSPEEHQESWISRTFKKVGLG